MLRKTPVNDGRKIRKERKKNNEELGITKYKKEVEMKKLTYVKPKVVGTANVHPC